MWAHDHARAASIATHSSDTTVAVNEHALAAGEFAKAASGTGSAEALRMLRLLEQHHQRLSELLRYPTEHPVATSAGEAEVQATTEKPLSTSAAVAELRASKSDIGPRASSPLRTPPSLPHPRRQPSRDLGSSITSNLASARGIRSNYARQPLSPSVSAQQAPGNIDTQTRREGKASNVPQSIPEYAQPSWIPPAQSPSRKAEPKTSRASAAAKPATSPNDEGFSRFYNTFENILSKLSAPLAFAGLPLTSEGECASKSPDTSTLDGRKSKVEKERSGSDPDLTKFISRAALRATATGQSGNDSFYVVPPSGHTVSYAQMVTYEKKEQRRLAASMHSENPELFVDPNDEDDFYDAKEMPPSPTTSRHSIQGKKVGGRDMENRIEELSTENQTLKVLVDKLSKRLHAFEMAAQSSSMAIQESMRLMRPMSPPRAGTTSPAGVDDEKLRIRTLELERRLELFEKEHEKLVRENDKLAMERDKVVRDNDKMKESLAKYRERWERLKEGAKTRRGDGGKDNGGKDGQGRNNDPGAGRFVAG